jgi:hypothetical protein
MMQPPLWLQELRDLLAITGYDGRHEALMRWERRWLVDLHCRQLVNPQMITAGRIDMLAYTCEHVQHMLGQELGKVMVSTAMGRSEHSWGGEPWIEVRGDVRAIRREPKIDD